MIPSRRQARPAIDPPARRAPPLARCEFPLALLALLESGPREDGSLPGGDGAPAGTDLEPDRS